MDPKPALEKACESQCTKQWSAYEACKVRIEKKPGGTCEPWAFDYWSCIDKCVSTRGRLRATALDLLVARAVVDAGVSCCLKSCMCMPLRRFYPFAGCKEAVQEPQVNPAQDRVAMRHWVWRRVVCVCVRCAGEEAVEA